MHPVRRLPASLALGIALLAFCTMDPAAAARQAGPSPQEPAMQGLPPAPPPSGIRRSQAAAERQRTRQETGPVPRRAETHALDLDLGLEVRGLEQEAADAALRDAVETVRGMEKLLDPRGEASDGLAALNAAAGGEPVLLDPRLVDLLERALTFCTWSEGAHGPLGGEVYAAWGLRTPAGTRPTPARLARATAAAQCDHLRIDPASGRAQLAAGSWVEPWGFATGWLVDGAVETLLDHGVEDALVQLGWVWRAVGSKERTAVSGPLAAYRSDDAERGWPVALPELHGEEEALAPVWLRDEALTVASAIHRPIIVAGDRYAPWIDQRTGTPASGVAAVIAVSERALDAQALGASLFVLGNREGLLRVGGLKPEPSVLWLLGSGHGKPVLSQYNWSDVGLR